MGWTLNGAEVHHGAFLTVVVNFLLLALVPFGSVKLLKKIGLGNFRSPHSLAALARRFANAL